MMTLTPLIQRLNHSPMLRAGEALASDAFRQVRRRMILDGCKWDPQVGDVETLAPFPILMKTAEWETIAGLAESLSAEAVAAEAEICQRPQLLRQLGFPSKLAAILFDSVPFAPSPGRVMRFDFHYTTDGWRISEVNSDVPGGFGEGSLFPELMAEHYPGSTTAGDPAAVWCEALTQSCGPQARIVLLSAPGYMEDFQVTSFLASRMREAGCNAHLAKPDQIEWRDGYAWLQSGDVQLRIDAIIKFYQAEWLSRLPHESWRLFFRGGRTPVANPALAAISESKRFPLVWDKLSTPLPTWRELLPETRSLRDAPWAKDDGWILKTAMCNNGDTVRARDLVSAREWQWTRFDAALRPSGWVAQRRFESLPVATPAGPRHACIGLFTVNGKAAGSYTRLASRPVIDFAAADAALLLKDND